MSSAYSRFRRNHFSSQGAKIIPAATPANVPMIVNPNGLTSCGWVITGAQDINNKGQVVGGISAYIWDEIHGVAFLGISDSYAYGVNNNGQVVGRYDGYTAFFWDPNDGMTPLGALGGYDGHAMSINDAGDVVGWADIANRDAHAFIWNKNDATGST